MPTWRSKRRCRAPVVAAQILAGARHDVANTLGYQPSSQITSVTQSNALYDWTLGANFGDAYTQNGLNQYLTAGGLAVTHDARGNTTAVGTKAFSYNASNQLTAASGGGLTGATLSYDPAGRLFQVAGSATTRFLYDGASASARVIAEYEVIPPFLAGLVNRLHAARFSFWAGVNPPLAMLGRSLL